LILIWHRMNHSVKRTRQALHQTHHHYYLNISVEAANLSDWRIGSKKIDSVARIESKLFLPELECSSSYRPTRQNYLVALGGVNLASQIQERRSAFSTDKNERWSRFIFRFSALNSVRESYCHLFKNTQLSPLGRTVSSRC